jgi:hypothetical protein
MPAVSRLGIRLACLLFLLVSISAFGGDGMTITLRNNTSSTLLVTVYDLNANHQRLFSGEEVNSFASIDISISADRSGLGHLAWTATNTDRDFRRCGHHDKRGLKDDDVVDVYANSRCGAN